MASLKEKRRMRDDICSLIEDSGHFEIVTYDRYHVAFNPQVDEPVISAVPVPGFYFALVNDRSMFSERYMWQIYANVANSGNLFSAILYRDSYMRKDKKASEEAGEKVDKVVMKEVAWNFDRLGGRAKVRDELSLKNYQDRPDLLNKMIKANVVERFLLQYQLGIDRGSVPVLSYYKPAVDESRGAVEVYSVSNVYLDYSHVKEGHPSHGYVKNGQSEVYKIASLHEVVDKNLVPTSLGRRTFAPVVGQPRKIKTTKFREVSWPSLPGLNES